MFSRNEGPARFGRIPRGVLSRPPYWTCSAAGTPPTKHPGRAWMALKLSILQCRAELQDPGKAKLAQRVRRGHDRFFTGHGQSHGHRFLPRSQHRHGQSEKRRRQSENSVQAFSTTLAGRGLGACEGIASHVFTFSTSRKHFPAKSRLDGEMKTLFSTTRHSSGNPASDISPNYKNPETRNKAKFHGETIENDQN